MKDLAGRTSQQQPVAGVSEDKHLCFRMNLGPEAPWARVAGPGGGALSVASAGEAGRRGRS